MGKKAVERNHYEPWRQFVNLMICQLENTITENFEDFGGDWKYNEIIGYLRFYKYVDYFININCFYYEVDKKRIAKIRKKQFIPINDTLYKITIKSSYDNQQITKKITEMVN
jgi:hypothetical protein